jgi:hypothetical protein
MALERNPRCFTNGTTEDVVTHEKHDRFTQVVASIFFACPLLDEQDIQGENSAKLRNASLGVK